MNKTKVLIVDDSSVIRGLLTEVISSDPELEVVGEAKDPYVAREQIKKLNPDVITLDVEMPKMDGITFLSNLMRLRPMPVIMLSTLTTKGADITLEALELGAVDFIAKPSFEKLLANRYAFKDLLLEKIKSAVKVDQKSFQLSSAISSVKSDKHTTLSFAGCKRANHIVAIGSSTGGTDALRQLIHQLPVNCPPVVIAQHIPPKFSERFATRLNGHVAVTVQEARHGQKLKEGNVYVAPGDKHLQVVHKNGALFSVLDDSEPVNRHKPSVDVLFDSLEPIAANVQAVLLTGMGQDGAAAMARLKNHGARTMIQNKATSLIWGMPGAAYALNAHTSEHALQDIAQEVLAYAALTREEMKGALNA
ncbi:protein-glutamate methylesterase/protein-glutamine glutaminase [Thalassotalea euphylliae]|uniref:Protein-glutamate methylesterase/protein-glutamine glutaminase n=1 Tax=Thalassotalea euphylliae TaxID=1655234 RepID=A0A3E0TZA4_9GAMM|nr:chemotaxis response regulator protein-glutamate methylesterase [Thalassotalea euphylliae]REL29770.1 chemotaxis response regulator protein-glutamate methylesterase [Thalassotalea euphylliae]